MAQSLQTFLHRNLRYEPDDDRRRFIINVFGQGGVGPDARDGYRLMLHRSRIKEKDVYQGTESRSTNQQESVRPVLTHFAGLDDGGGDPHPGHPGGTVREDGPRGTGDH